MNNFKFQCRTQHCVCRDLMNFHALCRLASFNAARSIVCVETQLRANEIWKLNSFNAARSIVCVETRVEVDIDNACNCFNAARSIVCVETSVERFSRAFINVVSMPHAALCVSRPPKHPIRDAKVPMFQCRTQHCVCRDKSL